MPPVSQHLQELQNRDRDLKSGLTQLGEMRPGSLVECYRKCGKPNCRCARPDERGHGPPLDGNSRREGQDGEQGDPRRPSSGAYPRPAGRIPALSRAGPRVSGHQRADLRRPLVRGPRCVGLRPKKTALAEALVAEVEEAIEALLGAAVVQEVDLEAVETALLRRMLRVAARQLQERSNSDHSDHTGPHPTGCLRPAGALRRPAREALRQRAGGTDPGAGLLSLFGVRPGTLPSRPDTGLGEGFLLAGRAAHGGQRGGDGEL